MKNMTKILTVALIILLSGAFHGLAEEVGELKAFESGEKALASEVNANFSAIKTAVDDNNKEILENETAIADLSENIAENNSKIDDLGVQPGVAWSEGDVGGAIETTSGSLRSLNLNAPADGYAIVTASGSVVWNVASAAQGLVRLKVSKTSGDTDIGNGGVQFIRFQSGLGTGIFNFPFSTTRVFSVSKGLNTVHLNGWHQVVNGTATIDDFNLTAIFVPNKYTGLSIIDKPIIREPILTK